VVLPGLLERLRQRRRVVVYEYLDLGGTGFNGAMARRQHLWPGADGDLVRMVTLEATEGRP
jgi:hypothetical protein